MFTQSDIEVGEFIKCLLMAPPKGGKTVCAVKTSPPPVFVLNADPGGLISAMRHGAKFNGAHIYDEKGTSHKDALIKGIRELRSAMAGKNPPRTIVVDTVSMLSQHLELEFKKKLTGWDIYRELKDVMIGSMTEVLDMPAHVILTGHAVDTSGEAGSMGIVPLMSGQAKTILPALCNDWLWLEVTPSGKDQDERREFLLGPQGAWKHGCRSLKSSGKMEADFTKFIKRIKDELSSNSKR